MWVGAFKPMCLVRGCTRRKKKKKMYPHLSLQAREAHQDCREFEHGWKAMAEEKLLRLEEDMNADGASPELLVKTARSAKHKNRCRTKVCRTALTVELKRFTFGKP